MDKYVCIAFCVFWLSIALMIIAMGICQAL